MAYTLQQQHLWMQSEQLSTAWAAGLFDGEGTATTSCGRPRLALRMVDEEIVRRLSLVAGVGTVYGPYDNGPGRQDVWMWVCQGEDAKGFAARIMPFLCSSRCEQIRRVFGPVVSL